MFSLKHVYYGHTFKNSEPGSDLYIANSFKYSHILVQLKRHQSLRSN